LIAPSNTQGAVILSQRGAARKLVVFQWPCGTAATSRCPRRARPWRRAMLVVAQVSSITTRRSGFRSACRSRQTARAALFAYLDEDGEARTIDSDAVNRYIAAAGGGPFTAKDFRTWAGTVLAFRALCAAAPAAGIADGRRQVADAVRIVAGQLGNTPAVCRKSYIHPAVVDAYLEGTIGRAMLVAAEEAGEPPPPSDDAEAAAIIRLLARQARRERRRAREKAAA
jgi:hypothetical protein